MKGDLKMKRSSVLICIIAIFFVTDVSAARRNRASRRTKEKPTPTPRAMPWSADDVPDELRPFDTAARTGDDVDTVLNMLELAHGAHILSELDLAALAYDAALTRIDTVDAKSKTAKRARSKFVPEEEKVFKGEPYERSMAYFYRGILAAQQGDYELARACFRSASFYDSSAALEYEGDYVIHYWMEAKMDQLLGLQDRADEVLQWASESAEMAGLRPRAIPSLDSSANVILVLEAGSSPVKVGIGAYGSKLHFDSPTTSPPEAGISLLSEGTEIMRFNYPTEDILAQARSRGQRMADRINNSKAAFKSFTQAMGTGAMVAGAGIMGQSRNRRDMAAGAGVAALGLLATAISKSANPAADTRYWKSLPSHIYIVPLVVEQETRVQIRALRDQTSNSETYNISIAPPAESELTSFVLVPLRGL